MVISGINYALLLGGPTTAGSAPPALDPLTALKLAKKNEAKEVAREAKDPVVARDVALFRQGIAKAKDVTAALQNPNVLKVLLTSNNLGDQAGFTALAQKALMSDPSDPKSLVSKLADTRWKTAAQTYDFAKNGLSALQDSKVQDTLANAYAAVKWRESLNKQNPGLSNAMRFQAQAASITNVDQILGDKVNRDVVLTALNIPPQIAYQTLDAQERAVSKRLDVAKLQDPHFVQTLTQQYLLNKAQSAQETSSAPDLFSLVSQVRGIVA